MKITDIEPILLSVGGPEAFAEEIWPRSMCLVRISTDVGLTGLGETYLGVFAPEVAAATIRAFRPLLLDCDPLDIVGLNQRVLGATLYWTRSGAALSAFSGIDCALWDLAGKAQGVPAYQLLGGLARPRQATYASCGPARWPVERTVESLARLAERGFRAAKLNVGYPERGPAETLAMLLNEEQAKLQALRTALGSGFGLMLDACQGICSPAWPAKIALQVAAALEPFGLTWLEEPCAFDDLEGWAQVRANVRVRIAGGEAAVGRAEISALLQRQAVDILQPDAAYNGGISLGRTYLEMARAHDTPVALHCYGTAAAMAANIHLGMASPGCAYVEYPVLPHPLRDRLWVEPPELEDGYLLPPQAPGLGIHFDPHLSEQYPYIADTAFSQPYTLGPRWL